MPEPTPGQTPETPAPTSTPAEPTPTDRPAVSEYERTLRAENAAIRKERDRLKQEADTRAAADLTETERTKAERDEARKERDAARAERDQTRLERLVTTAASRLRFADPEDALALLNADDLGIDPDTGRPDPDKVERALKKLSERKPYLLTPATTTPAPRGSAGAPTNGASGVNTQGTFTKSQISDRAFYEKNRDAIMLAMREGRITEG